MRTWGLYLYKGFRLPIDQRDWMTKRNGVGLLCFIGKEYFCMKFLQKLYYEWVPFVVLLKDIT